MHNYIIFYTIKHNIFSAAQFRFLNEKLYTTSGSEARELFRNDPTAFRTYHEGYQQQLKKWPINPLDVIIKKISKMYVYNFALRQSHYTRQSEISKVKQSQVKSFLSPRFGSHVEQSVRIVIVIWQSRCRHVLSPLITILIILLCGIRFQVL